MKKNLQIIGSEPKETKDGKAYRRINTNEGWHSCFDLTACAELKELNGQTLCCEVEYNEGTNFKGEPTTYKNIIKVYGKEDPDNEVYSREADVPVVKPGSLNEEVAQRNERLNATRGKSNGTASMYTSYAKDIFVAINEIGLARIRERPEIAANTTSEQIMTEAIKLVKQAKEAFE